MQNTQKEEAHEEVAHEEVAHEEAVEEGVVVEEEEHHIRTPSTITTFYSKTFYK